MRVYSAMPSEEFIAQLRDVAIAAKAGPLFLDQIDQLRGVDEDSEEIEEINGELLATQNDRDEWKEQALELKEKLAETEAKLSDAEEEISELEAALEKTNLPTPQSA